MTRSGLAAPKNSFLRSLYFPLRADADREIELAMKVVVLKAEGSNTTEVQAATGAGARSGTR